MRDSRDLNSLHGHFRTGPGGYSRLLEEDPNQPSAKVLEELAARMVDTPDKPSDKPDPEENLYVPAGYTYLSQFVDHDLTFDTTSTLDPTDSTAPTNQRTPRFDLDSVYGPGPAAAPFMYQDGVRLVECEADLPRSAPKRGSPRAIIGDPRNDENSIICNLQMAFLRFHNLVVQAFESASGPKRSPRALFEAAQNEVRWTYQKILVEDLLPRIVAKETLEAFENARDPNARGLTRNESAYTLYTRGKRCAIPLEFSGAVYRFGHSMVRNGYRLNANTLKPILAGKDSTADSLVGFQPLPPAHVIDDWSLFFPNSADNTTAPGSKRNANNQSGPKRLQFAYRIDTTLGDPLGGLPPSIRGDDSANLAARNLFRGRKFQLPSGQAVATALGVQALERKYLVVRRKDAEKQTFEEIPDDLLDCTPLWFYILAEAQVPIVNWRLERGGNEFTDDQLLSAAGETATQLGPVGGRVILEVFHGLLDADPDSYRNHTDAAAWQPLIGECRMWNLVNFQREEKQLRVVRLG